MSLTGSKLRTVSTATCGSPTPVTDSPVYQLEKKSCEGVGSVASWCLRELSLARVNDVSLDHRRAVRWPLTERRFRDEQRTRPRLRPVGDGRESALRI